MVDPVTPVSKLAQVARRKLLKGNKQGSQGPAVQVRQARVAAQQVPRRQLKFGQPPLPLCERAGAEGGDAGERGFLPSLANHGNEPKLPGCHSV